jgi:hypothetical protein
LIWCFVTIILLIGDQYASRFELGEERLRAKNAKADVYGLRLDVDLARKQVMAA